jgi:hypothetical protein
MQSDDRDIEELIKICETEFGIRITPKEAQIMLVELTALYEQLVRPLPSETKQQSR